MSSGLGERHNSSIFNNSLFSCHCPTHTETGRPPVLDTSWTGTHPVGDSQPSLAREFDRELEALLRDRGRRLLGATAFLFAAFWFLDVVIEPRLAYLALGLRLGVAASCLVAWLIVRRPGAARWAEKLVIGNGLLCAAVISLLGALMAGWQSTYFVGIMLVIGGLGLSMPIHPLLMLAFGTATAVLHLALTIPSAGTSREMVAHFFFLVCAAAFTALGTFAARRTLWRDLSLRLQLEKANQDLLALDEAKTRFFANVSHELRTPLTLLLGPIDTLRGQISDPGHSELLASMRTNATRLLRQVNALLDIAKLESGSLDLATERVDVGELIGEVVQSARPLAESRGLELRFEQEKLRPAELDVDKIWVIAANLVSNALKFTKKGHITVRVRNEEPEKVVFEVEDTGSGIPESELEKVFDRFYQVDSSSARTHEGTGVGLALARELARLHGGDLVVHSEVGVGSTFRATLPARQQHVEDRRSQPRRRQDRMAEARRSALAAQEYRRALRDTALADVAPTTLRPPGEDQPDYQPPEDAPIVLVVDDNQDLRHFMARALLEKYRVVRAADGVEALEALQSARIDLVVSDVMMPRMDGEQLCKEIRADSALASIPIIMVTARAGAGAIVEGLEYGADDYLVKPFVPRELVARVGALLRRKAAEEQLSERDTRLAAIGQMSSAIAHDLRNALTVVKGYAELAGHFAERSAENGDGNAVAEPLKQIGTAVDRLGRMTEEMLNFARGGTPQLAREQTTVAELLRDVAEGLRGELERRSIDLELEIAIDASARGSLDTVALARVIENLIHNARDALAGEDEPRTVRLEAQIDQAGADEGRTLLVEIQDNGPGIPVARLPSIFEPFHSGKRSTGLGLATVRNLVRAHGGTIEAIANGRLGGATFRITIPLDHEMDQAAVEAALQNNLRHDTAS